MGQKRRNQHLDTQEEAEQICMEEVGEHEEHLHVVDESHEHDEQEQEDFEEEEEENFEEQELQGQESAQNIAEKRLAKKEQKEQTKTRKLARTNGEIVDSTKKIWEELRKIEKSQKERQELMKEMMCQIQGKITDLVFKHDASRMIQCALKFGNQVQRDSIAEELKKHTIQLSKSLYGKFIVSRILSLCSIGYRQQVIQSFHGHVTKLIKHKHAASIMEEAYQFSNATQRSSLVEEFYGPEFALFKDGKRSLNEIIIKSPEKKAGILKNLCDIVSSVFSKEGVEMGPVSMFHRVILNTFTLGPDASQIQTMIDVLKDHLVSILHTREGAKVAQLCIIHATPKDRKHILKTFKSHVQKVAIEQYGHLVLLTCFESIDDTVLVHKTILQELTLSPKVGDVVYNEGVQTLADLLRHKYAREVFMFMLVGRSKAAIPHFAIQELESMDQVRLLNCKKEKQVKEKELIASISQALARCVEENASVLMKDQFASPMVVEMARTLHGDKSKMYASIAKSIQGIENTATTNTSTDGKVFNAVKKMKLERDAKKVGQSNDHMMIDRISSKCLKDLVLIDATFAKLAFEAIQPSLEFWFDYCYTQEKSSGTAFMLLSFVLSESTKGDILEFVRSSRVVQNHASVVPKEKSGLFVLVEHLNVLLK